MFQNGPIRKVITKKVILEDFLIFSPAIGHPGLKLKGILEDFFKKSQVRNSHYLFQMNSLDLKYASRERSITILHDSNYFPRHLTPVPTRGSLR